MYNLFNKPSDKLTKSVFSSEVNRVLKMQYTNIERIIHYYRNKPLYLESNNIFVRLIQSLPVTNGLSLRNYIFLVEDHIDEIANGLQLTSVISRGKFREGELLGDGVIENYILIKEDFSLVDIENNWIELEPIRFLSHPKMDLTVNNIYGLSNDDVNGYSTITINLPMLAIQYYMWSQINNLKDYKETIMQFVVKHPIPNSFRSYHSIALFNLTYALFNGDPIEEFDEGHPFHINPYFNRTIDVLSMYLLEYSQRRISFHEFISILTLVGDDTIQSIHRLPKVAMTKNIIWPLSISRLKLISFMVKWDANSEGDLNRKDMNRLKRTLKELKSDKTLESMGNRDVSRYVKNFIDKEIKPYL